MNRKNLQKHLTEVQIDALARKTALTVGSAKTVVDPHLSACISCKAEFEMLLELYLVTARELDARQSGGVAGLTAPLELSGVLELRPFHPESDEMNQKEEMLLLAAQGTEARTSRYHHAGTFASRQAHVLVRAIRDMERMKVNLHLITPVPADAPHVLLAVTIPGKDTFMTVTDGDAKAIIPDPGDIDWNGVSVLVSPLLASFPPPLREGKLRGSTNEGPFLNIVSSPLGWKIDVCNSRGSKGGHLVAVTKDGSASIFDARESPVLLTIAIAEHLRELRLFN